MADGNVQAPPRAGPRHHDAGALAQQLLAIMYGVLGERLLTWAGLLTTAAAFGWMLVNPGPWTLAGAGVYALFTTILLWRKT
jgi:hypothetical protein